MYKAGIKCFWVLLQHNNLHTLILISHLSVSPYGWPELCFGAVNLSDKDSKIASNRAPDTSSRGLIFPSDIRDQVWISAIWVCWVTLVGIKLMSKKQQTVVYRDGERSKSEVWERLEL